MTAGGAKQTILQYVSGREFVIVLIVLFSSLSFTLGYFVGKGGSARKTESVSGLREITPVQKPSETVAVQGQELQKPVAVAAIPAPASDASTDEKQPQKKESSEKIRPVQPASEKQATKGVNEAAKQQVTSVSEKKPAVSQRTQEREIIYSVQMGAFKNRQEASALAERLKNNGYKAFISETDGPSREKIYKVRTGTFKERKDAEILALRIQKSEGLNAFVTGQND